MTKYKKAILDIINMSYNHLTSEEIYLKLKEIYPDVVLATVYNNLAKLLEEDLICKVVVDGATDRYDKLVKHDHLVCKKCGKLIDFNFDDLTKELSNKCNKHIIGYELKAYILCDECAKKENK